METNNDDFTKAVKSQTLRLKLVDGSNVTGQINLNRHPMYERVSDIVTQNTEQFLVLFAVSVDSMNTGKVNHKTLLINREHIIWAAPQEIE